MFKLIILAFSFYCLVTSQTDLLRLNSSSPFDQFETFNHGRRQCNLEQVEYRLTRLEVQVAEKSENLRSEVRESNRRLQALELQNAETQSNLESLKAELGRFTLQIPERLPMPMAITDNDLLGRRVENIAKGVQILVAAVKVISLDLKDLHNNVSTITNNTRSLMQENRNLLTKEFFGASLHEIKHAYPSYVPYPAQTAHSSKTVFPKNCRELSEQGKSSGIYMIQPEHSPNSFMALCDMDKMGGGWSVIQNRFDGSQDFFLNWHGYKQGFGNLAGEFWLGLEQIYALTGHEINELLIELEDFQSNSVYAHYSAFSLGSVVEGYPIKVLGGYDGDAGDSLIYHAGAKFSTVDVDQDNWLEGNCALSHGGAWWYKGCDTSNLNGKYLGGELPQEYDYQGMYWGEFKGSLYSLEKSRILVRPSKNNSISSVLGSVFSTNKKVKNTKN